MRRFFLVNFKAERNPIAFAEDNDISQKSFPRLVGNIVRAFEPVFIVHQLFKLTAMITKRRSKPLGHGT
jgi:hypothetical protein